MDYVSQRIGFGVVKRLALEGASVVLCSRKTKNVEAALERLNRDGISNVFGMACHVSNKEQRETLVEKVI